MKLWYGAGTLQTLKDKEEKMLLAFYFALFVQKFKVSVASAQFESRFRVQRAEAAVIVAAASTVLC